MYIEYKYKFKVYTIDYKIRINPKDMEFIHNFLFPQDNDLYEYIFFIRDNNYSNPIFFDISHNLITNSQINNEIESSELTFQSIRHQSLYETNPNKKVTSSSVLENLVPIRHKHAKNRKEHPIFPITQKKFKKKSKIIQLPCNHCFSSKAIIQWLSSENNVCPVCKYEFESTYTR
jgi:hypothetical protein